MQTFHIVLPYGLNLVTTLLSIIGAIVVALLIRFVAGFITG